MTRWWIFLNETSAAVSNPPHTRQVNFQSQKKSNTHTPKKMAFEDIDTGLQLYLRQIGEYPLLTIEEEVKLARRIKRGDKEARATMVRSNLRLVVKIARDYSNFGLPLLDLISEGNIGLMKAVERFDPKKGGKLSTYAAWWIKQSIKRALANQSKTIRLPVHLVDKIAKLRRVSTQMTEELGREPTDEELAEEVGMAASKVSAHPEVRTALVALQHGFRRLPGLVSDGRDMGTVIFADAPLKVFLTASAARRAQRRHKQLISKGISVTLAAVEADLEARDARDSLRSTAPLKPADDALLLDNSDLSIEASIEQVLLWWRGKRSI